MNFSLLAFVSGSGEIAGCIFFGLFLGALLAAAGFTDASRVRAALKFDDKQLLLTILATLFFAILFFQIGDQAKIICLPPVADGFLWSSLAGGALCGIGLALAGLAPLSALGSFASGKLGTLITLAGMIVALVTYPLWGAKFSAWLTSRDMPIGAMPKALDFFPDDHFAFLLAAVLAVLILILQWMNKGK